MTMIASQITSLAIVYSTIYSDADQRKHQSSASLAFVRGIHRRPVNSPHKWPVTRKMFPFDDVIMIKMGYLKWPYCMEKEPWIEVYTSLSWITTGLSKGSVKSIPICWLTVNCCFRKNIQWNFNENTKKYFERFHLIMSPAKFLPTWFMPPCVVYDIRDNSRFTPSQWETSLLCNDVSHWLGANLESSLWNFLTFHWERLCYSYVTCMS